MTNRDLGALAHRLIQITLTPVTRSSGRQATSALVDPVAARVREQRFERAARSWLTATGKHNPTLDLP